jgi:carotenoid cleavage dioxygenase-like enzyme
MVKIEREIPIQIDPGENPFLNGIYAPISTEITADNLNVTGEIPRDLDGAYLRNGPNPIFQPRGRYHWFDGDGMVHGIEFHDGKATYRNRWIRTEGFAAEQDAKRSIWPGLMDRPDPNVPRGAGSDGWLKDSANTDLVFHNGYLRSGTSAGCRTSSIRARSRQLASSASAASLSVQCRRMPRSIR